MLAMADRRGRVWASIPGLANRARVSVESTQKAIQTFLSPDPFSRTSDNEGRRIEPIDGGWRLLNHEKYREIRDEESIKESKRRYINNRRATEKQSVTLNVENVERGRHNAEADSEAEADSVIKRMSPREIQARVNMENRKMRMAEAKRKGTHTHKEWIGLLMVHGGKCVKCGTIENICKDHIEPVYLGGSDSIENIQPMCGPCNSAKGPDKEDLRLENWRELLERELLKPPQFDHALSIYEAFPRKVARPKALKAIEKALKKVPYATLLALTQEYAELVKDKELHFIPYPASWFNAEGYNDNEMVKLAKIANGKTNLKSGPNRDALTAKPAGQQTLSSDRFSIVPAE
jgi:5-methylcytosine-specific restriction endonuclease McrA